MYFAYTQRVVLYMTAHYFSRPGSTVRDGELEMFNRETPYPNPYS